MQKIFNHPVRLIQRSPPAQDGSQVVKKLPLLEVDSALDDTNVTYDGINHQWTKTTADYGNEAGHENAMVIDSNGHVHIVHASGDGYAFTHSVYDGSSWTPTAIKNCEGSYCWDTHMVIDDNDELHAAYSTKHQ